MLPWEFGILNLLRRPLRTALTLVGLTVVTLLVLVVVGFVRGLERSLAQSGDPQVALVFSLGMGENLEYSSVPASTADLVSASVQGVVERYGQKYASPELYLATHVHLAEGEPPGLGLVRGLTPAALLVRRQVEIVEGSWPAPGEILVGRLAATKLAASPERLRPGETIEMEGRAWTISGTFAARGGVFEAELWCRLDDLQQALKRQALSLVAVTLRSPTDFAEVNLLCKEQKELQALPEPQYYAALQRDYLPVKAFAALVAALVASAGVLAGLNTMYGAVVGRVRELATLQTIGFRRRAMVLSLVQEGVLLAVTAALVATVFALLLVNGAAMQFTMGAFELRIDAPAVLIGCTLGVLIGIVGAIPPAIHALRREIVEGLKAV